MNGSRILKTVEDKPTSGKRKEEDHLNSGMNSEHQHPKKQLVINKHL